MTAFPLHLRDRLSLSLHVLPKCLNRPHPSSTPQRRDGLVEGSGEREGEGKREGERGRGREREEEREEREREGERQTDRDRERQRD